MTDTAAETIAIGAYVFEAQPAESDYDPRCGVVVDYGLTDDGDEVVVVLRERAHAGKLEVRSVTLRVADLDAEKTVPPHRMVQAARSLCRAIADRGRGATLPWSDHDDLLLVSAHRLVHPESAQ